MPIGEPLTTWDYLHLNLPGRPAMCGQELLHWTEKIQDISFMVESPTGQHWS